MRLCKEEALKLVDNSFQSYNCPHCFETDLSRIHKVFRGGEPSTSEKLKESWDEWECVSCGGRWQVAVEVVYSMRLVLCHGTRCDTCTQVQLFGVWITDIDGGNGRWMVKPDSGAPWFGNQDDALYFASQRNRMYTDSRYEVKPKP